MLLKAFFEKIAGVTKPRDCLNTLSNIIFSKTSISSATYSTTSSLKSRNVWLSITTRACLQVHWSKRPLNCQNCESD